MHDVLLFLHLAAVIVWVGGMFFAHFCLRPVAAELLPPPQRLPLLAGVLGRFFAVVALAVTVIVLSGIVLMLQAGFAHAPLAWHLMMGLGLLMAVIFVRIYGVDFRALRQAVAEQQWPAGGAALQRIRGLVATNLGLGALTVAVATLGRNLVG